MKQADINPLEMALELVNVARTALNKRTLAQLFPGIREDVIHCPIRKSLGAAYADDNWVEFYDWREAELVARAWDALRVDERLVRLPEALWGICSEFDEGKYPELEVQYAA
jgi:hypothetical protein